MLLYKELFSPNATDQSGQVNGQTIARDRHGVYRPYPIQRRINNNNKNASRITKVMRFASFKGPGKASRIVSRRHSKCNQCIDVSASPTVVSKTCSVTVMTGGADGVAVSAPAIRTTQENKVQHHHRQPTLTSAVKYGE